MDDDRTHGATWIPNDPTTESQSECSRNCTLDPQINIDMIDYEPIIDLKSITSIQFVCEFELKVHVTCRLYDLFKIAWHAKRLALLSRRPCRKTQQQSGQRAANQSSAFRKTMSDSRFDDETHTYDPAASYRVSDFNLDSNNWLLVIDFFSVFCIHSEGITKLWPEFHEIYRGYTWSSPVEFICSPVIT